MQKLYDEIDNIKVVAKGIMNKVNKAIENIEIYDKIYQTIVNCYQKNSHNYEILENISHIDDNVIYDISQINNDFKNQFIEFEKLNNKMTLNSQINLIYDIIIL